jgi:transcriptional regulator with XRE-family HTH domain
VHAPEPAAGEESIGTRIRRLRLERGLSQRELSGPGVSYAYVSRIEAGQREPSLKALRILARKLRVSLEMLETGAAVSEAHDRQLRLADAELELSLGTDLRAAEESFRALLVDARESGDTYVEARARAGRGIALAALGEARTAAAELERALDTDALVPELRPEAYRALARCYRRLGMPQRAVQLLERCVEELGQRPPGDEASAALYTTYLSQALEERGEAAGARIALLEARERLEAIGDARARVRLYWSLARAAAEEKRFDRSLAYTWRAVALLEANEDTVELARAHLTAARMLVEEGQGESAGIHLERAEWLLQLAGEPGELGILRTEQSRWAAEVGRVDEALERAREAVEILDGYEEQGGAWYALGVAHALRNETDEADAAFRSAVDHLARGGDWREAARASREWARALRTAGREAEAFEVMEQATLLTVRGMGAEARRAR